MSGRVVIVTGAGSGIGRATACHLARGGDRVVLVGRRRAALEQTAGALEAGAARVMPQDLSDLAAVPALVDRTLEAFGRLDAIVAAAATGPKGPVPALDAAELEAVFAPNLFAPALMVARAWPTFLAQGAGAVVAISSLSAAEPDRDMASYVASKAGLEGLVRALDREGRDRGIRAFALAPGAVETPMLRALVGPAELPPSRTLAPEAVAAEIGCCLDGDRDDRLGEVIVLPNGGPGVAAATGGRR